MHVHSKNKHITMKVRNQIIINQIIILIKFIGLHKTLLLRIWGSAPLIPFRNEKVKLRPLSFTLPQFLLHQQHSATLRVSRSQSKEWASHPHYKPNHQGQCQSKKYSYQGLWHTIKLYLFGNRILQLQSTLEITIKNQTMQIHSKEWTYCDHSSK